jgi:hypothetical protein
MIIPLKRLNEAEIAASVKRAEAALTPDVVRIRYSFEDDWVGEPSIFFRVVFTDEAFHKPRLIDMIERARGTIRKEVDPEQFGLHSYFNYGIVSELAERPDPAWA